MSEQQGDVGWPPPDGPDGAHPEEPAPDATAEREPEPPPAPTPPAPSAVAPGPFPSHYPPPPVQPAPQPGYQPAPHGYPQPLPPGYPHPQAHQQPSQPAPYPQPGYPAHPQQQPYPPSPYAPPQPGFGPLGYEPPRTPLGEAPAWFGGAPLGGVPQPVGAMTVRPAGDPIMRRRRIAGAITALGGAAVIAGSFADWVRSDILGVGLVNGSGWENVRGHVGDGPAFAVLGLVLVLVGTAMLFGLSSRVARIVAGVAAVGALGGTIYEIIDITSADRATLLAGPWIMLGGAVVGLLGLLMAPGETPAPTAPPASSYRPPPTGAVVPPPGPPLLQ